MLREVTCRLQGHKGSIHDYLCTADPTSAVHQYFGKANTIPNKTIDQIGLKNNIHATYFHMSYMCNVVLQ